MHAPYMHLPCMKNHARRFANGLNILIDSKLLVSETGGDCWLGGVFLCRLLEANRGWVEGKRVVELGAGTGFLSMAAHLLGSAECVCTDRGNMLELMRKNFKENRKLLQGQPGTIIRCECDWDAVRERGILPRELAPQMERPGFDLVLASDVIYEDVERADALVAVLCALCTPRTIVLLCQSCRNARLEAHLFEATKRAGFRVTEISQNANCSPDREAIAACDIGIWRLEPPQQPATLQSSSDVM